MERGLTARSSMRSTGTGVRTATLPTWPASCGGVSECSVRIALARDSRPLTQAPPGLAKLAFELGGRVRRGAPGGRAAVHRRRRSSPWGHTRPGRRPREILAVLYRLGQAGVPGASAEPTVAPPPRATLMIATGVK